MKRWEGKREKRRGRGRRRKEREREGGEKEKEAYPIFCLLLCAQYKTQE